MELSRSGPVPERIPEEKRLLLGSNSAKPRRSRWGPVRQLLVLSAVYMLGYSPLTALMNLEGILNPDIGLYALLVHYGGALVSFFTAPILARIFGAKGSVLLGLFGQGLFIAVHFYVEVYLLLPVSFLVGITHAQMWISNGVYVTTLGLEYSEITGQPQDSVMGVFQGVFFSIFTTCGVWSNLVSSLVLIKPVDKTVNGSTVVPQIGNLSDLCGPAFCPWEDTSGTYIEQPDQILVYIILGAFLGFILVAFTGCLLLLRNIHANKGDALNGAGDFCSAMIKLLWSGRMLLMIPVVAYISVEQELIQTEFTKAFVSCEIGIQYNGWSMICYASGQIIGSTVTGRLLKFTGWPIMYVFATAANASCLASMLLLDSSSKTMLFYFLVPFVWGLADSVWLTQSSAVVGHFFPDQKWPVFVTIRSAIYAAMAVVFAYSNFVCMDAKIYIAFGGVLIALVSFMSFTMVQRTKNKKEAY
ncbi:protein unc-93 homolog A [Lingula anatina]|uniref:Protein unc-93 homolog A n=1 Tax=Lingula anatina TaxID=7574 RepID=A0A1S3H0Q6_LINAN|nr:protein unc-93 homolog A [Lingula anatina]|eukprot:XP_013379715.1 protein unc-93 homolog A [Lingula anatina]